jgi:hypothetical protein
VFFFAGVCTVTAQDLIILKNGNIIEAQVTEISPTEIRYKRFDHLNGPTFVVPTADVLTIRYENGMLEVINDLPVLAQTDGAGSSAVQHLGEQTPLQIILNALPPIRIAGNSLKFQFGGDNWVTTVNGENFSAGTIELEDTDGGVILNLKQTHIWPGAAGKTAGRIANMVPGGGAVGGVLETAGSVAGAVVGSVEASGPVIVLEYKEGPPAKLSYSRRASERSTRAAAAPAPEAEQESAPESKPEREPRRSTMDPDKFYIAFNGNGGGTLIEGTSFCVELGKGAFNTEINLIFPSLGGFANEVEKGFGVLVTFNRFWHSRIGGFYLGGGGGFVSQERRIRVTDDVWVKEGLFDEFIYSFGANLGYKFVTPAGLYFRVGGYAGIAFGYLDNPVNVYFKPDLAMGWSF